MPKITIRCPGCGRWHKANSTESSVCPKCQKDGVPKNKKNFYSIREVVAIEMSLEGKYKRYFGYPETSRLLKSGKVIVDSLIFKNSKYIAKARLKQG